MSPDFTIAGKGVAILLVICCHMVGHWIRYFTPLGGIGVCMFLILSGYGMNESYRKNGIKNYWRKRLICFIFPYAFLETIRLLPNIEKCSAGSYLMDIFCIRPLHPFGWYMRYLLLWYIIFYLSNILIKNQKGRMIIILSCSIILFLIFRNHELEAEQSLSFPAGILLSELLRGENKKKEITNPKNMWICFCIGIFVLAVKQTRFVRSFPVPAYNVVQLIIMFTLGSFCIMLLDKVKQLKIIRGVYLVGLFSFELYMIHGIIMEYISMNTYQNVLLFILVSFVFSIVAQFFMRYLTKHMLRRM